MDHEPTFLLIFNEPFENKTKYLQQSLKANTLFFSFSFRIYIPPYNRRTTFRCKSVSINTSSSTNLLNYKTLNSQIYASPCGRELGSFFYILVCFIFC